MERALASLDVRGGVSSALVCTVAAAAGVCVIALVCAARQPHPASAVISSNKAEQTIATFMSAICIIAVQREQRRPRVVIVFYKGVEELLSEPAFFFAHCLIVDVSDSVADTGKQFERR